MNPQLSLASGVYQNTSTQIRESLLSNYIKLAVNDVYHSVADLSLFSIEIEKLLLTDELRAALSPSPANYLLSFNFDSVEHALDLTQDFGGVSHFLADKVSALDSVKVDLGQAKYGVISGYNNIAGHGNFEPATKGGTVDGGDNWFDAIWPVGEPCKTCFRDP